MAANGWTGIQLGSQQPDQYPRWLPAAERAFGWAAKQGQGQGHRVEALTISCHGKHPVKAQFENLRPYLGHGIAGKRYKRSTAARPPAGPCCDWWALNKTFGLLQLQWMQPLNWQNVKN